jgi:hypothetical protein
MARSRFTIICAALLLWGLAPSEARAAKGKITVQNCTGQNKSLVY